MIIFQHLIITYVTLLEVIGVLIQVSGKSKVTDFNTLCSAKRRFLAAKSACTTYCENKMDQTSDCLYLTKDEKSIPAIEVGNIIDRKILYSRFK